MPVTGSITDPQTVTVGSVSYTGVKSISWNKSSTIIPSPAADGNTRAGAPYLGSEGGYSGTITFDNPILAEAMERTSGTMTVAVKGMGGASDGTKTFLNVIVGSASANVAKDAGGSASLPFSFGSSDGTTAAESFT